jgi:flagellar protein FlgJ
MITGPGLPPRFGAAPPSDPKERKLLDVAHQLEGVFVGELYKAMRATVPTDGLGSGGAGEEMFASMMDERVAADTPQKWQHGLADALLRQLRGAQSPAPTPTQTASDR